MVPLLLLVLVGSGSIATCGGTIDINRHELQMVTDHLTDLECHKLYEALQLTTFYLDRQLTGTELPGKTHVQPVVTLVDNKYRVCLLTSIFTSIFVETNAQPHLSIIIIISKSRLGPIICVCSVCLELPCSHREI